MVRRTALVTLGLFGVAVACTGSDPEPYVEGEDAGSSVTPGPGVDSGNGSSSGTSGAVADAGRTDAADADAEPDAGAGPFTLTVNGDGSVRSGVNIVISQADGSYVDTVTTDANGKATYTVDPAGMMFTVLYTRGGSTARHALTVVDVRPGDDVLMRWDDRALSLTDRTVMVNVPADTPPAGTASYRVSARSRATCVSTSPVSVLGFNLIVNETCSSGLHTALVLEALDNGGNTLAYAVNPDLQLQTNQPTIGSFAKGWVGPTSYDLTVVNPVPTSIVHTSIVPLAAGFAQEDFRTVGGPFTSDGGALLAPTAQVPVGLPQALEHHMALFVELVASGQWQKSAVTWRRAATPAATIDFLADGLPGVGPVALDLADSSRPKVTWAIGPSLDKLADGATTSLAWKDGASMAHEWSFYLPPTAKLAQVPVLPAALSTWSPTPGATYDSPGVVFSESDAITGYRELIKVVEPQSVGFTIGPSSGRTLPKTQRLRISACGKATKP